MEKELKPDLTKLNIKGFIKMEGNMGMENLFDLMAQNMKDSLKIIISMVMGFINGQMVEFLLENELIIKWKAKGNLLEVMADLIQENIRKIKKKVLEFLIDLMVDNMKDNDSMENSMETEFI